MKNVFFFLIFRLKLVKQCKFQVILNLFIYFFKFGFSNILEWTLSSLVLIWSIEFCCCCILQLLLVSLMELSRLFLRNFFYINTIAESSKHKYCCELSVWYTHNLSLGLLSKVLKTVYSCDKTSDYLQHMDIWYARISICWIFCLRWIL